MLWDVIGFLLIGFIAGWLAGLLMRGRGFGCIGNVLIGAIGGLVGGLIFRQFGWQFGGFIGSLFTALVGAILLVFVTGLLSGVTRRR